MNKKLLAAAVIILNCLFLGTILKEYLWDAHPELKQDPFHVPMTSGNTDEGGESNVLH